MSRHKNPVNDLGVTAVYGIDSPTEYQSDKLAFVSDHRMIPEKCIVQLNGIERLIFAKLYAGSISKSFIAY